MSRTQAEPLGDPLGTPLVWLPVPPLQVWWVDAASSALPCARQDCSHQGKWVSAWCCQADGAELGLNVSHTSDATWWRVFAGPRTCRTRMSLEISRRFRSFGLCRSGKTTKEQFQFRDTLSQSFSIPESIWIPSPYWIPVLFSSKVAPRIDVFAWKESVRVALWKPGIASVV